jgi:hypothetical protein
VKKNRYIFTALMIISIITTSLLAGCAGKSTTQSPPTRKYDIVKVMNIVDLQGAKWKVYQLRLTLEGGATFTIDLNLSDGDTVKCLYTTEKPTSGGSVNFQVKAGTAVIYPSGTTGSATTGSGAVGNTSDLLSFTAAQANGTSYKLIFHNNLADKNSKETIYTEITYPATDSGEDSIFIPLETN